jgi:hypothetical protein
MNLFGARKKAQRNAGCGFRSLSVVDSSESHTRAALILLPILAHQPQESHFFLPNRFLSN